MSTSLRISLHAELITQQHLWARIMQSYGASQQLALIVWRFIYNSAMAGCTNFEQIAAHARHPTEHSLEIFLHQLHLEGYCIWKDETTDLERFARFAAENYINYEQ